MVEKTLDAMAAGGMYDLVGGGFHRYSVDDRWLVPHFEKMLYDNALLASAYLHAWVVTGEARYRAIAEETLDYVVRELRLPERRARLRAGRRHERRRGAHVHLDGGRGGARPSCCSPFEHGRSIIRGALDAELARAAARRARAAAAARARRQGARVVERPRARGARRGRRGGSSAPTGSRRQSRWRSSCSARSRREDGRLSRSWREGKVSGEGFLDDYANVAHGLLELHVATGDARWLREARRLALLAVELFHDPEHGGFFLAPTGGEELVARTKGLDDNPIPSGNSMLAHVLLRLGRIWGDDELERLGVSVLRLVAPMLAAPRARSAGRCARSTCTSRRRGSSRSRARSTAPVARAALAAVPAEHRRRGGAGRRRPAARGEGPRRREAGGLRVRAIRLPGAGRPTAERP